MHEDDQHKINTVLRMWYRKWQLEAQTTAPTPDGLAYMRAIMFTDIMDGAMVNDRAAQGSLLMNTERAQYMARRQRDVYKRALILQNV